MSAETHGHELAEELDETLNSEFKATSDYRTAVEEVIGFFESVIAGLDADAREPHPVGCLCDYCVCAGCGEKKHPGKCERRRR